MIEEILKKLKETKPQYSLVLPVSKKTVNFNPFKISDQKTLSIISQENNIGVILKNICNIIKNCSNIETPEELYIADLEFLFLHIRGKSVEEEIKLIIKKEISTSFKLKIDEIICKNGVLEEQLILSNGTIVEAEQLKTKDYFNFSTLDENELIKKSIKAIIIERHRYDLSSYDNEDLQKIINEISIQDEKILKQFIKSAPHLYYSMEQNGEKIEIEGFLRFFISV